MPDGVDPSALSGPLLIIWLLFAAWIVSIVVITVLVLRKKPVADVRWDPATACEATNQALRAKGYDTTAGWRKVEVRVDSLSAVRLHFAPSPVRTGTTVRYEVMATPMGWGVVLLLMFLPLVGALAGPTMASVIDGRVRRFVRERVVPVLRAIA